MAATPGEFDRELPEVADRVLAVVDQVPAGRVVTYGDIAAVVGVGPRQVGSVLSEYGALVAWWRVRRSDGRPPHGHEDEAIAHYREEDVPMRLGRVPMRLGRVDLRRARHTPLEPPDRLP